MRRRGAGGRGVGGVQRAWCLAPCSLSAAPPHPNPALPWDHRHFKQYVSLRQFYLRRNAGVNYWRKLHLGKLDGVGVHKSTRMAQLVDTARSPMSKVRGSGRPSGGQGSWTGGRGVGRPPLEAAELRTAAAQYGSLHGQFMTCVEPNAAGRPSHSLMRPLAFVRTLRAVA